MKEEHTGQIIELKKLGNILFKGKGKWEKKRQKCKVKGKRGNCKWRYLYVYIIIYTQIKLTPPRKSI